MHDGKDFEVSVGHTAPVHRFPCVFTRDLVHIGHASSNSSIVTNTHEVWQVALRTGCSACAASRNICTSIFSKFLVRESLNVQNTGGLVQRQSQKREAELPVIL